MNVARFRQYMLFMDILLTCIKPERNKEGLPDQAFVHKGHWRTHYPCRSAKSNLLWVGAAESPSLKLS